MSSFPNRFPHHRLDVYNLALDVAPKLYRLADSLPRGHRSLADQLKRSSTSIAANIAEGANRRTPAEKRQRFADARAEAGESEAWLELLVAIGLIELADALPLAHELDRISAMLTRLIRPTKAR